MAHPAGRRRWQVATPRPSSDVRPASSLARPCYRLAVSPRSSARDPEDGVPPHRLPVRAAGGRRADRVHQDVVPARDEGDDPRNVTARDEAGHRGVQFGSYWGASQEVFNQRPLGRSRVICGSVAPEASTVAEAVIRKPLMLSRAQAMRWVGGGRGPLKQHDLCFVTGQN